MFYEVLTQLLGITNQGTMQNMHRPITLKITAKHNILCNNASEPNAEIGEKHLVCQICGRWCNSKSSLLTHLRVHTGEKPFACDVCGKKFTQKATLQRHRHLHTGEKHFKCEFCTKRFYRKDKLYEHRNVHR